MFCVLRETPCKDQKKKSIGPGTHSHRSSLYVQNMSRTMYMHTQNFEVLLFETVHGCHDNHMQRFQTEKHQF